MKNLWIQAENAFATWIADFTPISAKPAAILDFVRAVLISGKKHRVFDVSEAPTIGYRRGAGLTLDQRLADLLSHDRILDLFGFTGAAMLPGISGSSTVEAALCYYDRSGQLVEGATTDPGALLASLEPAPDSIPNGMMRHYPAMRVTGRQYVSVQEGTPVDRSAHPYPVAALFAVHSDIWFPWIFGSAHPEADHVRMFDNRELANCHTPRLNAFLTEIATVARRSGGTFGVWPDETTGPFTKWVDDQSVLLDWMPPDGVMPPEMLEVKWSSL